MKLRDWFVQDEIQSAFQAARHMFRTAKTTSHFWLKHLTGIAIPAAIGISIGIWIISFEKNSSESLKDIISSILTFACVLTGFIITSMLFTGKVNNGKSLTVDQVPEYKNKITYLLFSQVLSLSIHVTCIALCFSWLCVRVVSPDHAVYQALIVLIFGTVFVSLFRTVLLPFQIYEIHLFELDALHEEKIKEYEDSQRAEQKQEN